MLVQDDEYDDQQGEDTDGDEQSQDEQESDTDTQDVHQAVASAPPAAVDAHRDMLSEVFQTLEGQGVNTSALAAQAGAGTTDPNQMSHTDLIQTTLALARQHPEVVQMVAQRFPEAQGILNTVLSSGGPGGSGGLLGSILGRL